MKTQNTHNVIYLDTHKKKATVFQKLSGFASLIYIFGLFITALFILNKVALADEVQNNYEQNTSVAKSQDSQKSDDDYSYVIKLSEKFEKRSNFGVILNKF
jgi:uncharacterized protein YutD